MTEPIMPSEDFYNGTSTKHPTDTADDTTSKLPPAQTDYELCDPVFEPLGERLNRLTERQATILNHEWGTRGWPKPAEMDWPQLTELGRALTAVESDAAIAPPNTAIAHMALKMSVASQMAELDLRIRHMCMARFSNYGIDQYASGLVTEGQCNTMLWCLANIPEHWLPEATDITDTAKPFDEVAAEQEAEVKAEEAAEEVAKKLDASKMTISEEHMPPAEYDSDVPLGSWGVIKDWIHEGEDSRDLNEAQVQAYLADRAHRALIAEIRRRGGKQRKVIINGTQKLIPEGYIPPYMRVPQPTEDSPVIAQLAEMTRLSDNEALHIIISNSGVRFWMEVEDNG